MSTQPVERHVRLCPTHNVEVEERGTTLFCRKGWHAVSHFKVLDRLKGQVTEVPVEGNEMRGGIVENKAAATARPKPVEKPALSVVSKAQEPNLKTLETAVFEDDAGATLRVKLQLRRTVRSGEVHYVRWSRFLPKKKAPEKTATLAMEALHDDALAAFWAAVAEARKGGWRERAAYSQRRQVQFEPLPKATVKGKGK